MAEKRLAVAQQRANQKGSHPSQYLLFELRIPIPCLFAALNDVKEQHSRVLGESGVADDARIKATEIHPRAWHVESLLVANWRAWSADADCADHAEYRADCLAYLNWVVRVAGS